MDHQIRAFNDCTDVELLRQLMTSCWQDLVDGLDPHSSITDHLITHRVFSPDILEEILSHPTRKQRCRYLVGLVKDKTAEEIKIFLNGLNRDHKFLYKHVLSKFDELNRETLQQNPTHGTYTGQVHTIHQNQVPSHGPVQASPETQMSSAFMSQQGNQSMPVAASSQGQPVHQETQPSTLSGPISVQDESLYNSSETRDRFDMTCLGQVPPISQANQQ